MIISNLNISFKSDITDFSHKVTSFYYGLSLTGLTAELFEWDLIEIEQRARMIFNVTVRLNESELENFVFYIVDDNKTLTIDGFEYAVVNDESNYKTTFNAWRHIAGTVELKLAFLRRGLGVEFGDAAFAVLETQSGDLVETDDGLLIEIH